MALKIFWLKKAIFQSMIENLNRKQIFGFFQQQTFKCSLKMSCSSFEKLVQVNSTILYSKQQHTIEMIKAWVLCLLLLASTAVCQQQLSFGVKSTVQSQLDNTLTALVNELRLYNTSFQDNTRLQRQVDFTWDVLSIILRELTPYNSVTMGQGNTVNSSKDIIMGNYNNITGGGSNYIFTNYYTGKISGDLVIERYRIEMDKKNLIQTNPEQVIFFLTPAETTLYSKYFGNKPNFGNQSGGIVTLFKLADIGSKYYSSYSVPYQAPPTQPAKNQTAQPAQSQQNAQPQKNPQPAQPQQGSQPQQFQQVNQQSQFQLVQSQQNFQQQPAQTQQNFQQQNFQQQPAQNQQNFQQQPAQSQQGFQQQNFQQQQQPQFQTSLSNYGNFQPVSGSQQSSGNLRQNSGGVWFDGYTETSGSYNGFTVSSSGSSSGATGGFVRV